MTADASLPIEAMRRAASRLPGPVIRAAGRMRLWATSRQEVNENSLGWLGGVDLENALQGADATAAWESKGKRLEALAITDRLRWTSPAGERRALFHIASYLAAASVLEIGTHIGAGTAYLAAALEDRPGHKLVTVDIVPANDPVLGPWRRAGSAVSAGDLVRSAAPNANVTFVTRPSLEYLKATSDSFDLIFLDGAHDATTVYREMAAATWRVRKGGYLLLHDYYPRTERDNPLSKVWRGPFLAVQRLLREASSLAIWPLGSLPWATGYARDFTSLALIGTASPNE